MAHRQFYLLALYAMKLDPATFDITPLPEGGSSWAVKPDADFSEAGLPIFALWAAGAVADSEDEAQAKGLNLIMQRCPPEEGWINHSVSVNPVSRTDLESVYASTNYNESTDEPEWPDLIL